MPFASEVECQLPNTGAHSGEVQLLMDTGDTKDDLKLPTFVKIGEHTDDDENLVCWKMDRWPVEKSGLRENAWCIEHESLAANDINNELKIEFDYRPHQLYAKVEAQQSGSHSKETVSNRFKTRTRTTGVRSMRLQRSSRNSRLP